MKQQQSDTPSPSPSPSPSPRELRRFVVVAEPPPLLQFDPAGFLAQLLAGRDDATSRHKSVSEELFYSSSSIEEYLLRSGLPRNPDAEAVLKELFTPKLLREAISRVLHCERGAKVPLSAVAALCFVCHPYDSLQEIRFLRYPPYRSDGRTQVWGAVADGLASACRIVPPLWTALEPGERRLLRGPDCLVSCLQGREYRYLLSLPAFIVEQVLDRRTLPEPTKAQKALEALIFTTTECFESPGLLPVLKFLRRSTGRLPERLINTLTSAIYDGLTVRDEHGLLGSWIRAHRKNEPVRDQMCVDTLVRQFVHEVMEFEEMNESLSKFGGTASEAIAGMKADHARLLDSVRSSVKGLLALDPEFQQRDVAQILGALEGYNSGLLISCDALCTRLKAGANPPRTVNSGCELALKFASPGFDKLADARDAFESATNRADAASAVVARVALASQRYQDVASFLRALAGTPAWGCIVRNWDLVPEGHESVLYRAMLAHGPATGLPEDAIRAGCRRWGNLSDAEIETIVAQGLNQNQQSAESSVRCFVVSLSKLEAKDLEFLSWRAAMTREVLGLTPIFLVNPLTTATLLTLLYEGSLTEELQGSPVAAGLRSYVCSLKLPIDKAPQWSTESQKILDQVHRWLNGAFSDYALERGLVTPVSVFLEHYGQTRRTMRDLLLIAKSEFKRDPSSESTRTLLLVVQAFHSARTRGHSLERLRRKLIKRGLLQYEEQEISFVAASETYLRRYGLKEEKRTPVQFPALAILKRIRESGASSSASISGGVRGDGSSMVVVARRSREELKRLVSQCRAALEAEITLTRPHSILQLLKIPAEVRQLKRVLARIILGTVCVLSASVALSSIRAMLKAGKDEVQAAGDMAPNGSIPKGSVPLAKLSKTFKDPQSRYLLKGLVGASDARAAQPVLNYPGLAESRQWVLGRTDRQIVDLVDLDFYEPVRGMYGFLPLGARGRNLFTKMGSEAVPIEDVKGAHPESYRFAIFQQQAIDPMLQGDDLVELLGPHHHLLANARVHLSEISRISPALFQAILAARGMPAAEGAEHLRTVVSSLIQYQESPQYNDFDGDFREYFETILKSGKGICGQFSVVLDEALKQAGIPCCIAEVYLPDKDGVTYTTAGAHAANIVFLAGPDKEVIPRIFDATGGAQVLPGVAARPSDPFTDLVVPVALTLGGLSLAALLIENQRRRYAETVENEAVTSISEETLRGQGTEDGPEITEEDPSKTPSPAQSADDLFSQWLLHHLQERSELDGPDISGLRLHDLKDDDVDQVLRSANRMRDVLLEMTVQTRALFSKTGLFEQESTIGIFNGWLRSMESPSARRAWVQYIQRRDLFSSREAEALMRVAREVVPGFKTDTRGGSIAGVWRLFSRPVPLETNCILRAFVPLAAP